MVAGATRRKSDPKEGDFTKVRSESITFKWLAGICVTVLVLAGGGWLTWVQSTISGVVVAMDATKEKVGKQAVEQATTAEQVKSINQKVDDVKKDVQDIRSDIKLILQNQQLQQLQQQGQPKR